MKWRFEIENALDTFDITPNSGRNLSIQFTKSDERRFDYEEEIKDIVLIGNDYKYFYNLEKSDTRCELQTFRVYMTCGGQETVRFEGIFAMSSGVWDLERCTVSFKVKNSSPYKCIENDKSKNLYDYNLPLYATDCPSYFLNTLTCNNKDDCLDCKEFGTTEELELTGWTLMHEKTVDASNVRVDFKLYAREEMWVPCGQPTTDDWILLENCVQHIFTVDNETLYVDKYYRVYSSENESFEPVLIGDKHFQTGGSNQCYYANLKTSVPIGPRYFFVNGFKLLDVIQAFINDYCPGLTVVSDFFQWNPKNQTSINYVTGETNLWTNLILHQKSDVKRMYPNYRNPSTKAEISFPELFSDILNTFNLGYKIESGEFIIEHVSWFINNLGLDLTSSKYSNHLRGTKKYSYNTTDWYKYEEFSFMESENLDFVGTDIVYNSECLEDNTKSKPIDVSNITTDIMHIISDQIKGEDKVSLDGFTLVACESSGSLRKIYNDSNISNGYRDLLTFKTIQVNPILDTGITINNSLSWAYLHDKLWKYGRIFLNGSMNGVDTNFTTKVPAINQEPINVILGCTDLKNFNPLDKIKSSLGWAFVRSAELKLYQCVMTLELQLESIQDTRGSGNTEYGDFDGDFDENFD
ncbi:hypothetical protein [Formosa sp. A9]|uniref:hypothetical protein n=1 Tax=Formosa sp. A9 TaxID=3442641 RepID=UPI003EB8221C